MHDYITTFSGRKIHLDAGLLRAEDIVEEDIFTALPHINRYTGHTLWPYSVAQHCLTLACTLRQEGWSNEVVKWALIHDWSEAYINDIASPFKGSAAKLNELEDAILAILAKRYGLNPICPAVVKKWDKRICCNELEALRPGQTGWWSELEPLPPFVVHKHSPDKVRSALRAAYNILIRGDYNAPAH